ncbi:MAG: hypothetical protein OXF42_07575 [Candidatus Dadabacteria bacterium]|nr:hypothetical protein [Candidatus Dadabacteria bacterium]
MKKDTSKDKLQQSPKRKDRKIGSLKGKIWISPDFDDPCPEIEEMFYGKTEEEDLTLKPQ